MLLELEVLNGEMSLKFDTLNTKYTVFIDEAIDELNLQYKLKDGANITIEGNKNLDNNSIITLLVSDDKESVSYIINVYKNKSENVNASISNLADLEINAKKEVSEYVGPGIACICFILVLFLFVLLFHKRKSK